MCIEFIDSYSHLSEPLRNFGKMFKLAVSKEIMPYTLYDENTLGLTNQNCGICELVKAQDHLSPEKYEEFCTTILDPANKELFDVDGDTVETATFSLWSYSEYYCKLDCLLLYRGYFIYRAMVMVQFDGLDILAIWTTASLADTFLYLQGVYRDVYEMSGSCRLFCERAVVGGRCMTAHNKKQISGPVEDFDAVSLYPSAMARLDGGYPTGPGSILSRDQCNDLSNFDRERGFPYFIIQITITRVNRSLTFPLMSYITDEHTREWTNSMEDQSMVVDRTTLHMLEQFHQIEYFVNGGLFWQDTNGKIKEVIKYCFEKRLALKNEKDENGNKCPNPLQLVYKLIMNASYGKTIQKSINFSEVSVPNDTLERYVCFRPSRIIQN